VFFLAGAAPGEVDGRHLEARRLFVGLDEAVAGQLPVRAPRPDAPPAKPARSRQYGPRLCECDGAG
jgi:hypothetical protein